MANLGRRNAIFSIIIITVEDELVRQIPFTIIFYTVHNNYRLHRDRNYFVNRQSKQQ